MDSVAYFRINILNKKNNIPSQKFNDMLKRYGVPFYRRISKINELTQKGFFQINKNYKQTKINEYIKEED